jgi:hypothetical protein
MDFDKPQHGTIACGLTVTRGLLWKRGYRGAIKSAVGSISWKTGSPDCLGVTISSSLAVAYPGQATDRPRGRTTTGITLEVHETPGSPRVPPEALTSSKHSALNPRRKQQKFLKTTSGEVCGFEVDLINLGLSCCCLWAESAEPGKIYRAANCSQVSVLRIPIVILASCRINGAR